MNTDFVRLGIFLLIFMLVALGERAFPRTAHAGPRTVRWGINLGFLILDSVIIRLLFPMLPAGLALIGEARGWGLFNLPGVPAWAAWVGGLLALDFIIFSQHALFHHVPLLWRLHRMHHTDRFIDVTSALRFHPLEMVISTIIKLLSVFLLGIPAGAVVAFEIILNGCAMFNHGNIRLPGFLDRGLRLLIVTPDMHRVHHSEVISENRRNFGFALSWWDRICGTYLRAPAAGLEGMTIGLPTYRNPAQLTFAALLKNPFH
ncbi:MAG: sterol desaturase family protein [Syntrophaceae bacterium]